MSNSVPAEYWEKLKPFAQSDRQHQFLDALIKCGTYKAAAAWLGVAERGIYKSVSIMKGRSAKRNHALEHDMIKTVPDGYLVKGTSGVRAGSRPVRPVGSSRIGRSST